MSPSGRYRLVVSDYRTSPGSGGYTRGRVFAGPAVVADVKRNYGIFHFGWAERHPNGHDYLLCGEDYQGQTVVELDTGRRADFIPPQAQAGQGFCSAAYFPSPDGQLIVIDGCHWACPYEYVLCRFDDPLSLPWPELHRSPGERQTDAQGWTGDGFVYTVDEDARLPDGKLYDEFTEAEEADFWSRRGEVGAVRRSRWRWSRDGRRELLGRQLVHVPG